MKTKCYPSKCDIFQYSDILMDTANIEYIHQPEQPCIKNTKYNYRR